MLQKWFLRVTATVLVCAGLISCGGGDNVREGGDAVASASESSAGANVAVKEVNQTLDYHQAALDFQTVLDKLTLLTKESTERISTVSSGQALVAEINKLSKGYADASADITKKYKGIEFSDEENQKIAELTATATEWYLTAITDWGNAIAIKINEFPKDGEIVQKAMVNFQNEIDEIWK